MKNNIAGLAISGLLLSCVGLAHAETTDAAATLSINGFVKSSDFSCTVNMSESSISILENPDSLIKQGDNATSPKEIHLSIEGGDQCTNLIAEGKITYKVLGVVDNADGTTLANDLTDETAAKGVGIGIFDADKKPVNVNSGRLTAHEDTVFGLQMVQLSNQEAVAGNINVTASVQIERL